MKSITVMGQITIVNEHNNKVTTINLGDRRYIDAFDVRSYARLLARQIKGAAR